jgi:hypothetical protein
VIGKGDSSLGYVVFDLETGPSGTPLNLERHIPDITVAATLAHAGEPRLWYQQGADEEASGEVLSREAAQNLVRYLLQARASGHTIVTWNGAGFDFRVLAWASGLLEECVGLSWWQVDMMFWVHCLRGFSIGLARAAEAVGSGKTPGLSGTDAPRLWAEGQYEQVKEYAAQDVRALAAVYEAAMHTRSLRWINTRGGVSEVRGQLLSVRESYRLPPPDTSWMRRAPWPREKFVGWMRRVQGD